MKKHLHIPIENQWGIPHPMKNARRSRLVNVLTSINRISEEGTTFYFRDFHERKIIVDSPLSTILCGYSKELVEKEGFDFYQRILDEKEFDWFAKAHREGFKIFFKYPLEKRSSFVVRANYEVKTANGVNLVLEHKATPYQFCDNGNLWLSLCSVSFSAENQSGNAVITNTETGERYRFENDVFSLLDEPLVAQSEVMLLKLLGNDLQYKEIAHRLKISERTFRRKKELLFEKLNVKNTGGAIYKAHQLGLI